MDEIITKLEAVKNALGTLNIISTPKNLNAILGSMQVLESVIEDLREKLHGRILFESIPF